MKGLIDKIFTPSAQYSTSRLEHHVPAMVLAVGDLDDCGI